MDIKVIELDREDMATHLKDMDKRRTSFQAPEPQSETDELYEDHHNNMDTTDRHNLSLDMAIKILMLATIKFVRYNSPAAAQD